MKNCPKCNSENIKKTGPFAREIDGEQTQTLSAQMVNYLCNSCNNEWQVKFSEEE
ncbi:MAG: IS1 family transposase [Candidatus Spechtbacteria bacterium]|nr:IS1 family transposase [Candidatus Spechtbacteria bacterium]